MFEVFAFAISATTSLSSLGASLPNVQGDLRE